MYYQLLQDLTERIDIETAKMYNKYKRKAPPPSDVPRKLKLPYVKMMLYSMLEGDVSKIDSCLDMNLKDVLAYFCLARDKQYMEQRELSAN